jgi:hypothetical protein
MSKLDDYPFEIRPLSQRDGGGFLFCYLDFAECISDGATVEETLANGRDALEATQRINTAAPGGHGGGRRRTSSCRGSWGSDVTANKEINL